MEKGNYCPFSFNGKCTLYPNERNDRYITVNTYSNKI